MWKKTGEMPLKTGDMIQIITVKPPDQRYEREIRSFLSPRKRVWMWHLNQSLRGELGELDSRFYLGSLKNKIISNVSTWEHDQIGIIGHLFTAKDHREKGACTALFKSVIHDFLGCGGKTLIGGFRPASLTIAKSLGFRSIIGGSEVMRYDSSRTFEEEYFQKPKKTRCRDALWKDWPAIELLFSVKEGWTIRSVKHRIFGPYDYENYFLEDMWQRMKGSCVSNVLVTEKEHIVGYSTLTLKRRLNSDVWGLDFFVHPMAVSNVDALLNGIDWPKGKTKCYVEFGCHETCDALLAHGFEEKKLLQRIVNNEPLKMVMMQRETESN